MEEKGLAQAIRNSLDGTRKRRLNGVRWLYGLAAFTSSVVFFAFWFTNVFRDAILSNLALRNGTPAFLLWQRPPAGLLVHVYVFNYTNLPDFESGNASKLRVEEVGPFVYRETLNRVNVELHENGTVTYQEKRSFQWIAGESEDKIVTVPNVLLMSAIAVSRNLHFSLHILLTVFLTSLQSKTFIDLPVRDYLWGYEDQLFRTAKPFASLKHNLPFDKFGIFATRNGLNEDRITMHTGTDDMKKIGLIERVNGAEVRKIWGDERCDKVYGTDGSMFPPHWIERPNDAPLYVYAKDVCRQMPFRYERRDFSNGIPTFRYKIPSNLFTWTSNNDSCFCPKESNDSISRRCPPTGIFNVSTCKFDTPLLVSFPHFYSGDESLFQRIDGLTPRLEHQENYIDLHQRLGITVATRMKFQLNLQVHKVAGLPFTGELGDGLILPLVWFDSQVDDLPQSVQQVLQRGHYLVNAVEAGFQWCSLVGLVLSFGALVAAFKKDERIDVKLDSPRNQKTNQVEDAVGT